MIQTEIDTAEKKKAEIESKLEDQKQLFINELVNFTKEWFRKETSRTVKENSDKIINIGEEKAKEMKVRIQKLIDNADGLVYEYMDKERIWWHTNQDKEFYHHRRRILDSVDKQIHKLFGELGQVFKEFKIIVPASLYSTDYRSNWKQEGENMRYAYGISYPQNIENINAEYVEQINKCQEINKKIAELKDKQKKDNIEEWWDSL